MMDFTPFEDSASSYFSQPSPLLSDRCKQLANPSWVGALFSLAIIAGIAVSYIPQHYRILYRRTTEGISPFFLLLGSISGTCALASILVLPKSIGNIGCCSEISAGACGVAMLNITQVTVQWMCFAFLIVLFIIFHPTPDDVEHSALDDIAEPTPSHYRPNTIAGICAGYFFLILTISLHLFFSYPNRLQIWANALGTGASILAVIQYLPQIWTTYSLKSQGSLSIPMMCMQTPGSFVWATSLAINLGASGWGAWGHLYLTGTLQGCLLCMAIYYTHFKRGIHLGRDRDAAQLFVGGEESDTDSEEPTPRRF